MRLLEKSATQLLADMAACALGFVLAAALPTWVSILGFVAVDALLLLAIRDSLLLNVIMLVRPIEAIRVWQSGAQA